MKRAEEDADAVRRADLDALGDAERDAELDADADWLQVRTSAWHSASYVFVHGRSDSCAKVPEPNRAHLKPATPLLRGLVGSHTVAELASTHVALSRPSKDQPHIAGAT